LREFRDALLDERAPVLAIVGEVEGGHLGRLAPVDDQKASTKPTTVIA
jgi:hypothetical protein